MSAQTEPPLVELSSQEAPKPFPEPETTAYSPGSREIVAVIIDIWKNDKSTESLSYAKLLDVVKQTKPDWALSEKRMKACLKEFNLQPAKELFTYVKQTKSYSTPQVIMPAKIKLQITKNRGKALYANNTLSEGDELWEEPPLIQAAPVEFVRIMRSANACAFCAKTLRTMEGQLLSGASGVHCPDCPANWCSMECRKADLIHIDIWHETYRNRFNVRAWKEYENHCIDHNWKAGYLYAIALMYKIKDDPRRPGISRNLDSMARIRQDIRQQAVSTEKSLEYEEHEAMWKRGHNLLFNAVRSVYKLTYEEYQEGIGMVNINNLDGSVYLVHSHLNHNCTPNVKVDVNPARALGIKVIAKTDIPAGRELVTSYVDPTLPVEERRYKLRVNWGFICNCDRCKEELAELENKPAQKEEETDSAGRKRGKSVHFDKNPVTQTVNIPV